MGEVVFLDVPYHEKDEAKRLGARWSPEVRKWYIPEGRPHEPFSRWLPEISDDTVLQVSAPIYAVESSSPCWSCGREISVVALAVEHLDGQEQDDEEKCLIVLSEIEELPPELLRLISSRYSSLKMRYSKTANRRYFMNHCSCGAPLGDFFLHSEPGAAFFPTSPEEAEQIVLRELPIVGSFKVKASYGQAYPDLISAHAQRESYGGSA
ncbi:MAG TPA: DUF5710 domain-containing protein [Thermoanaerobaculia bacterium]|nr:DUF5710 domain-containing protein [Thermoanaerobaculia bacterium]